MRQFKSVDSKTLGELEGGINWCKVSLAAIAGAAGVAAAVATGGIGSPGAYAGAAIGYKILSTAIC